MWPPMPLLVISPKHGRVSYTWERKRYYAQKQESIKVPPHTSILYVDIAMVYKFTVDNTSLVFKVQGQESSL